VVKQFEPDLLIVPAGFDAHERDPLGGMRVSTAAFGAMTRDLRAVAEECCRGRIVAAVEGGYDLHALGTSLDGAIDALAGPAQPADWPSSGIHSSRGEAAVAATSAAVRPFWHV
jgi:acetoin utilization deacetylase AcuC-like enzyme